MATITKDYKNCTMFRSAHTGSFMIDTAFSGFLGAKKAKVNKTNFFTEEFAREQNVKEKKL